ncbi:type VI secretion system contractile sheath large subunit [Falsiroseomonas oryziterrae]|uniref:type VI secretion system contractile sheath large subunit n=1 Tax=Falsiroseomonas oryziterrae TaxID=2911368 RepID=UPI001F023E6C|nr:type VI secretion system contractile sheath large subunit [Roseomonas sp. NPKOSM-4]
MDETIVLRPSRPAAPPLREAALAGGFFGEKHEEAAGQLAAFARSGTAEAAVRTWFGPAADRLLADRDALRGALDRDIAAIDTAIGRQLDAILHHPKLTRLEGSWRGLGWLVDGIEPGRRVKVRVLHAAWMEIVRDLERAIEFDSSNLFRLIYEQEFGTPGGEPYGLLVIDHEVRHRPGPGAATDDVGAIASLAAVGAAAFAPVVLGAHPSLLEVDSWAELQAVQDVAAPLNGPDHARWRGLASRADLRFVGIALPRLLARPPWRDDPARVDRFRYAEHTPDWRSRVWMSAAYAFAASTCRAMAEHGWPADVRGVETDRPGGGLVEHLPDETFASGPAEAWTRVAVEIALTDRQERQLVDAGMMPVCAMPYARELVFGTTRSLQAPQRHMGANAAAADASARISAQLNAMLCAARFAHFLKVIGRDMVGSLQTAHEVEARLHKWLQGYVNSNSSATGDQRARYPLTEGSIRVTEKPGKPGVFAATAHLRPHHQLDDVSASFILLTEISAPGRRGANAAS